MSIGRVLAALIIRGVLVLFVCAAMLPAARPVAAETSDKDMPPHRPSLLRACVGFIVSLVVTVSTMIGLSTPTSLPDTTAWPLRGSIASD